MRPTTTRREEGSTVKLCVLADPGSVHVRRWVNYLVKRGYEIHIISEHPLRGPMPEGVTFYDLTRLTNILKVRDLVWVLAVRRLVRKLRPDVLHAYWAGRAGWMGAASGYHPFQITAHGSDLLVLPNRSWIHRQISGWMLRRADYITCVSRGLAQKAIDLGANPDHVEVVYLGVNVEVFNPDSNKADIRSRLNLGQGPVVLSIRGMKPVYNPLDVAQAIPLVLDRVPSARFVVFTYPSVPESLAQFKALVRDLGVSHAVVYVDELSDDHVVADYYRTADAAISVSSSDGTPISVLEAMACGTPLVLSDLPTVRDWVRHDQEGLFVPVGDVAAISAATIRLLTDTAFREELASNSVRVIRQRADSRKWLQRGEEIHQHLVESRAGKVSP